MAEADLAASEEEEEEASAAGEQAADGNFKIVNHYVPGCNYIINTALYSGILAVK